VIENYQQYRVTKQQLAKFEESVKSLEDTTPDPEIHPVLWKAQSNGLRIIRDQLKAEVEEYEAKYRRMVYDTYNLLAGSLVYGHLQGVGLLGQVREECPEALGTVDKELEEEVNNG
jgi:hypothetical protein